MVVIVTYLGISLLLTISLSQVKRKHTSKIILKKAVALCLSIAIVGLLAGCSNEAEVKQNKSESMDISMENPPASGSEIAVELEIGETEQKELWTQTFVYPNNIDDTFVIDICLPDTYDKDIAYPVVYLTDCYWRREDYASIKNLYQSNETQEFILVGIGYPDDYNFDLIRERDLIDEPQKFLEMIINGVIPYVESNYNIDEENRSFCGASYGGFFMLYSLFQNDDLTKDVFKNYILASPTLLVYTNELSIPGYEEAYWQKTNELKANVYLTVGEKEDDDEFQIPIQNFLDTIQNREYKGFALTSKVYEGKDHYSVWVPTLLEGLKMYLANET